MQTKQQKIGAAAEAMARQHLQSHGLTLLDCNYSVKGGEIDLIMQDKDTLVFVEVRCRNNPHYAHSLETITRSKQNKIKHAAKCFLLERRWYDKVDCRFDAVGIESTDELIWIKNAF